MKLPTHFSGTVVKGFQRGSRQLGFPTANIDPKSWTIDLSEDDFGVYCGICSINNGPEYKCVFSIGKNVTFEMTTPTFEVHILNFDEDIYGEKITVYVHHFIRKMRAFKSIEDLKSRISQDCCETTNFFSKNNAPVLQNL
ncbi:Riboflavin kinase / FAD synthetase family protein [Trichomonas vaginalis G3]|uniref:riboflavin kinase n=1 Tax=Trichomonas vaginalis (strain ATCC PRA-98 / G3) TaxID=412133 RepID=A2F8E2_TRIV3|nr:riboflavin kinase protein [Trichomonas vaginalis G3]EAX98844.1 Riboflavin kinase / FAD synthetase family protein [Trichomonas vaginalis G3]KAI5532234.1 riboflavin kinase protein [Trichomonas vaginalis G3]|eukprot:XP_001311774.1 Riboflavin kinase / FAD synthetase family protein [Trichomonas vaginalis G3]